MNLLPDILDNKRFGSGATGFERQIVLNNIHAASPEYLRKIEPPAAKFILKHVTRYPSPKLSEASYNEIIKALERQ